MAHVYKRGKTWSVRSTKRVTVYDPKVKKLVRKLKQKNKGGFATKAEATDYGAIQDAKLAQGLSINKAPSLANYFMYWYNTYKKDNIRFGTQKEYLLNHKRIEKYFGDEKIDKITRQQYQEFINNFGRDHAPHSVKSLNSYVRGCVKSAIADKIIWSDFTTDVSIKGNKDKEMKVTYPTSEQFKKLFATALANRKPHCTSGYMIITAMFTGLREGEIAGLTWDHIDFDKGILIIDRQWVYKTKSFGPTKNDPSDRYVGVPPEFLNILKELKGNHKQFVFWSLNRGCLPASKALNDQLRRWIKKAGLSLPHYHFHSIRHSHTSFLIENGVDLKLVSRRLGHAHTAITEDVYDSKPKERKIKEQQKIAKVIQKAGL